MDRGPRGRAERGLTMHSGEIVGRVEPVIVRATGRRARRRQRRAEQPLRPEVYELVARHEDGRMIQHRSHLDLIRNVAAELRAEGGWRLFWKPAESRDYGAWELADAYPSHPIPTCSRLAMDTHKVLRLKGSRRPFCPAGER